MCLISLFCLYSQSIFYLIWFSIMRCSFVLSLSVLCSGCFCRNWYSYLSSASIYFLVLIFLRCFHSRKMIFWPNLWMTQLCYFCCLSYWKRICRFSIDAVSCSVGVFLLIDLLASKYLWDGQFHFSIFSKRWYFSSKLLVLPAASLWKYFCDPLYQKCHFPWFWIQVYLAG